MTSNEKIPCPKCGKMCYPMGLRSHLWRVHGNGKNFNPGKCYQTGEKQPWNKGLTRKTNKTVNNISKLLEHKKSPLEQKLDDDGKLMRKWYNKRVNANAEGLECKLTFDEYCQLVDEAGLVSSQLGFTGEGYVLARYNDTGNYEIGNCRFITQKENSDEKYSHMLLKSKTHHSSQAFINYFNILERSGIDPWH